MNRMKYREILTAGIGSGLEYYDFLIFGFFAPTFAPLFFPADNKFLAIIWGYSAFAIGFIFRPIGGVLFGHIGDRQGRKSALSYSILFMGFGTLLIGILPTYNQIGILAPILLILARIIQGISIGGEFAGGTIFSVEHGKSVNRTGLAGGLVLAGAMSGTLLASVANYVTTFSISISWRYPFILGFIISIIGLYIRKKIVETDVFENAKKNNRIHRYPIINGLKKYPKHIFYIALLSWIGVCIFITHWIFLPSYLKTIFPEINGAIIDASVPVSILICMMVVIYTGHLSDFKVKRSLFLKISAPSMGIFMFIMYYNIFSLSLYTFLLCQLIFAVLNGMWASAVRTYTVEVFSDVEVRYSSYAFANNMGEILGGLTPLIATILINSYNSPQSIGVFILTVAMIALYCIYKVVNKHEKKAYIKVNKPSFDKLSFGVK